MLDTELIQKAKAADLLDYLKSSGYQLIKSGRNEYRLEEHDSLVISNNKWHWKSRDIGGNPLDFVIKYEGRSFYEAVLILTNRKLHLNYDQEGKEIPYRTITYEKQSEELKLPDKNPAMSRVFAYLNKSRGIEREIISGLMHDGVLYESDRHNCVFLGKDTAGRARFACERGTLTEKTFKWLFSYWLRSMKKTLRRKDFWFAVTVYPLMVMGYMWARDSIFLKDITGKAGIWYFVAAFLIFTFIVFNVIWHVIERKLKHTGQGDKLKIKEDRWR